MSINSSSGSIINLDNASSDFTTGQVSPTSTATLLVAQRSARVRVIIYNPGSAEVFIGATSGVLTTTGLKLLPGSSLSLNTKSAVYGITPSGTGKIHYLEEYS